MLECPQKLPIMHDDRHRHQDGPAAGFAVRLHCLPKRLFVFLVGGMLGFDDCAGAERVHDEVCGNFLEVLVRHIVAFLPEFVQGASRTGVVCETGHQCLI